MTLILISELDEEEEKTEKRFRQRDAGKNRGSDRAAGGGFALAGGKKLSHARFAPVHSRREGGREKARAQGRNGGMEGGRSYSTEG